jgi:hypothetical protein
VKLIVIKLSKKFPANNARNRDTLGELKTGLILIKINTKANINQTDWLQGSEIKDKARADSNIGTG